MPAWKTLPEDCPLTECMTVLGGAWTPNIVWYLMGGPRRFNDLKRDLDGVSGKVLTTRLRRMERDGVVVRTVEPTSPPTVLYALTDLGRELVPVIESIVEVGRRLKAARQEAVCSQEA